MILSIIAAAAENNVIGKNNQLVWKLADDMAYFKEITLHHTVIMGRKTFDSMGKALPKRENIVVSRQSNLIIPFVKVVSSLEEALASGTQHAIVDDAEEVFLIGGAELYKQGMAFAQKIYLTRVHAQPEGDAFFPELNLDEWKIVSEQRRPADSKNQYPFSFLIYERSPNRRIVS